MCVAKKLCYFGEGFNMVMTQRSNYYEYNIENTIVDRISNHCNLDIAKDKEKWDKARGCTILDLFCYSPCSIGDISKGFLYDGGIVWYTGTV